MGVAAAVGGFVSLAKDIIDIGRELRNYYNEVRNADEALSEIILAVEANLQPVQSLQNIRGNELAVEFETTSALAMTLYSCQSRLIVLKQKLSETHLGLEKVGGTAAGFKRALRRLKWPFEAGAFKTELDDIRRYSLVFQFALSVDGFSLLSRSVRDISDILGNLRNISENYDSLHRVFSAMNSVSLDIRELKAWNCEQAEKREMEKRMQALDWLSHDRMLQRLSEILSHRHGSTGRWIIEQRMVQEWLQGEGDTKLIWCNGDPGVGKTMASAIVMDELQKRSIHAGDGEIGQDFAICDSQNPGTQTAYAMLAAITKQLLLCLSDDHPLWGSVTSMFESASKKQKSLSIQEMKDLLIRAAKDFSRIHVVLDGIDELLDREERHVILEQLTDLVKSNTTVALLAASRSNFEDIAHAFRGAETIVLKGQQDDIRSYIQDHLGRGSTFLNRLKISDGQAKDIERQLIDRCAGVYDCSHFPTPRSRSQTSSFLIAVLQTTWMTRQRTTRQVEEALGKGPQDLDQFYERTLDRIRQQPSQDRKLAFQIFRWISHISTDLTIDQLVHALSLDWDAPMVRSHSFDVKNVYRPADVVDVCLGLISVEPHDQSVRFVHDTVKVYFNTDTSRMWEESSSISIHGELARTCLTYMAFDDFTDGPCTSRSDFMALIKLHCFLPYAVRHIRSHLRKSSETDKAIILEQFERLLDNEMKRLLVVQLELFFLSTEPVFESDRLVLAKYPWIIVVTGWEYIPAVEASLHRGHSLMAKTLTKQTPLHVSASKGDLEMVKYLLDHKVDYTQVDWRAHRPVMLAASHGHFEIVKYLVERGSQLSWRDVTGNSLLPISVCSNQRNTVSYIMEVNPKPTFEDWYKAVWYAFTDKQFFSMLLPLVKGLHESIRRSYLQNCLIPLKEDSYDPMHKIRKMIIVAQTSNCEINIGEVLEDALETDNDLAVSLLEVSGTRFLPDPSTAFCRAISMVKHWYRFFCACRFLKREHGGICGSQARMSAVNWHQLGLRYDIDRELLNLLKVTELILIHTQDDHKKRFFESLLPSDTKLVVLENLFQAGVRPDVKLLCTACRLGDLEVIQSLAERSVGLDERYKGYTPLEHAARADRPAWKDQCATIDLLLELGAKDLVGAMKTTNCDQCALKLLKIDRRMQKLSYRRHRNALSVLSRNHLRSNAEKFRGDCETSQDDLDVCLVEAATNADLSAVQCLLALGANPCCYIEKRGPGTLLESLVLRREASIRASQRPSAETKLYTRDQWREEQIDAIIQCLSDPTGQQIDYDLSGTCTEDYVTPIRPEENSQI